MIRNSCRLQRRRVLGINTSVPPQAAAPAEHLASRHIASRDSVVSRTIYCDFSHGGSDGMLARTRDRVGIEGSSMLSAAVYPEKPTLNTLMTEAACARLLRSSASTRPLSFVPAACQLVQRTSFSASDSYSPRRPLEQLPFTLGGTVHMEG